MDRDKADFFQVRNPSCVSSHQACPNSHTLFEHIKRKTGKLDSKSNSFLVMRDHLYKSMPEIFCLMPKYVMLCQLLRLHYTNITMSF